MRRRMDEEDIPQLGFLQALRSAGAAAARALKLRGRLASLRVDLDVGALATGTGCWAFLATGTRVAARFAEAWKERIQHSRNKQVEEERKER